MHLRLTTINRKQLSPRILIDTLLIHMLYCIVRCSSENVFKSSLCDPACHVFDVIIFMRPAKNNLGGDLWCNYYVVFREHT